MVRGMAAYSSGLGARDSHKRVKDFRPRKYTSHRRVPRPQFDVYLKRGLLPLVHPSTHRRGATVAVAGK